ncbi:hypothetical protein D3C81_353660 [compost metagenome]
MIPPIAQICLDDAGVRAVFGTAPMRVYAFGTVEKLPAPPYSLWQTIGGQPGWFLAQRPDTDGFTTQHDVYAADPDSLVAAVKALRDAFEPHGYISRWGHQIKDPDTKLFRYSFDVDWLIPR